MVFVFDCGREGGMGRVMLFFVLVILFVLWGDKIYGIRILEFEWGSIYRIKSFGFDIGILAFVF